MHNLKVYIYIRQWSYGVQLLLYSLFLFGLLPEFICYQSGMLEFACTETLFTFCQGHGIGMYVGKLEF